MSHPTLTAGDKCPESGCKGKVYGFGKPALLVRIVGRAPVGAEIFELQRLRCNLCLKVFSAAAPERFAGGKYEETAVAMIALLRYGTGVPFNRLKGLQRSLGIPLPASTQWDVVAKGARQIAAARAALIDEAAQGEVFYNDDTPMKILALMEKGKRKEKRADDG